MRPRSFQLALLGFNLLPAAVATAINITVSHLSPTITYYPSRSGDSATTWNVTYVEPQDEPNIGAIGDGPSSHYTTFTGASASLGFVGTAIYVYGYRNGSDDDVALSVGGVKLDTNSEDGLLGWKGGLKNQWWDLAVNVTGSGGAGIESITFTTQFGAKGADITNTTIYALDESNNPNSQLTFSGSWTTGTEAGLDRRPYDRVDTQGQDARAILPSLGGPAFVLLYGSVNYDHSDYYVASSTVNAWPPTVVMNGESPWISLNEVIFFGELEDEFVLQNMNGGNWLDISSIVYMTASGGEVSRNKLGAILGGVLGGLGGLILLAVLLWWFCWRRRKSDTHYQSGHADTGAFEIDPYKETSERQASQGSYFDNPELAYASAASGSIGSAWADRPNPNPYESPAPYQPPPPPGTGTSERTYIDPFPPIAEAGSSRSRDQPSSRRLALVNPQADTETDAGTFPEGIVIPPDTDRKERRRQRPTPRSGVVQETDAGRVALVPPSYDPAWARDGFTNDSPPPMSSTGGSQTDLDPGHSELDLLVRDRSSGDLGESQPSTSSR